jgi:hypothetical protein
MKNYETHIFFYRLDNNESTREILIILLIIILSLHNIFFFVTEIIFIFIKIYTETYPFQLEKEEK